MSYSNFSFTKKNTASPTNLERINKLSDKFNSTFDLDQNSKFVFLKTRVDNIDNHLNEIIDHSEKKFNIIKENILKLQNQIEDENILSENLLTEKSNFIKILETKIFERFNQEQQIREEIGKKLLSIIDDKFNALKVEITKESRNRYESIENLKSYLENDVPKLNDFLKVEQNHREENDDEITIKILEEFSNLQSVLQTERKSREDTEEAILDTLRIMVTKTKSEIESQRNERESTEESLLSLLEETCHKLSSTAI